MKKNYLFSLFFIISNSLFSQNIVESNIETNELIEFLKEYPYKKLVGAYGNSDMQLFKANKYRDFGNYKIARIEFIKFRLKKDNKSIKVKGKIHIYGKKPYSFRGIFLFPKSKSSFISYNIVDKQDKKIVHDSVQNFNYESIFNFKFKKKSIYSGKLKLTLYKVNERLNILSEGLELIGNVSKEGKKSKLTFGEITPSSTGIFRSKTNSQKLCINERLLNFGWKDYIFANPQLFDCTFNPKTDIITPIQLTDKQIQEYKKRKLK